MSEGQTTALEVLLSFGGVVVIAAIIFTLLFQSFNQNDVEEFPETDLFVGACVARDFFHSPSETSEMRIGTVTSFFVENSKLNVIVDLTNPDSFGYRSYLSVDDSSLKKISRNYCRVLE